MARSAPDRLGYRAVACGAGLKAALPKKHVAIACRGCGSPGSVAAVALRHAESLRGRFDVSLVSDGFPRKENAFWSRREARATNFQWMHRFAHVPNEIAFAAAALGALTRLQRDHPIDALVCHGHVLAAITGRFLRRTRGVPFAMVTHGDVFDRPKGTYDPRLTLLYELVTPVAYAKADAVVALSPWMAEVAIRGGAAPGAVRLIPNGVALEDIGFDSVSPTKTARDDGPLRLLFVGRLAPEKGVSDLLAACQRVYLRGGQIRLKVVGDGPLRRRLEQETSDADLEGVVSFVGAVERSRLGVEYQGADVLCVPSINDPLPGVVLEGLAAGTPVIGTRVGGIPFMVQHEENGFLVPPGDPIAFAAAIERMAASGEARREMAERAAASVLTRFTWDETGRLLGDLVDWISR